MTTQWMKTTLPDYLVDAAAKYRLVQARRLRFKPLPWAEAAWNDQSLILLFTGSAGGGKSRLAGEMLHNYLLRFPGASGLALRKARAYTSKSVLPFLWNTVMADYRDIITYNRAIGTFYYANGSVLYTGGMQGDDQREALRSIGSAGGVDIIWMEEANAFTEADFNELLARLRGSAGTYRQIILTTNPDAANHWINQRLILGGEAKVYYSRASDNPYNSPEYLDTLRRLTGVLYERLAEGRWAQAAGAVYDNFDIERHVTTDADYDPNLPVIWGVDDGWVLGGGEGAADYHPRVIAFIQIEPNGRVRVFDEIFAVGELSEQTINRALAAGYSPPTTVYVDSSASELKARLWSFGLQTVSATHRVVEGIKVVRTFLGERGKQPWLIVHPRCRQIVSEFQSYAWQENQISGEPQPAKRNDHGMDAIRYALYKLRHGQ